jgi:hypothetical protein
LELIAIPAPRAVLKRNRFVPMLLKTAYPADFSRAKPILTDNISALMETLLAKPLGHALSEQVLKSGAGCFCAR